MKFSSMDSRILNPRKEMRKTLRARRRALSPAQQTTAAQQLAKYVRAHPVSLRSRHIAIYLAGDGEINPLPLMQAATQMHKTCYLPVLHPLQENILWFSAYREGDVLVKNRFGLEEPLLGGKCFPAWALDLVLMPLVGFDRQGHRLGMGGGFYDRTFAFKQKKLFRPKIPTLIGLAHHCQEVESLESESWDIPLDYIATDREIIQV